MILRVIFVEGFIINVSPIVSSRYIRLTLEMCYVILDADFIGI